MLDPATATHGIARRPASPILSSAGPLILAITVMLWLVLLWTTLVFAASPTAVVSSETGELAGWWERVSFAGFTVFTLGIGDYVPTAPTWRVLTVIASTSGLVMATAAITYLIPVVTLRPSAVLSPPVCQGSATAPSRSSSPSTTEGRSPSSSPS